MTRENGAGSEQQMRLDWMADEFRNAQRRRLSKTSRPLVVQPEQEEDRPAAVEIAVTAPLPPSRR